jgi:hypothetical protein
MKYMTARIEYKSNEFQNKTVRKGGGRDWRSFMTLTLNLKMLGYSLSIKLANCGESIGEMRYNIKHLRKKKHCTDLRINGKIILKLIFE